MSKKDEGSLADLMALVVHDLRNPVATVSANLSFVREVNTCDDEDMDEALADMEIALGDLMRGLDQLSWIGRWLDGPTLDTTNSGLRPALEVARKKVKRDVPLSLPEGELNVVGGAATLSRLLSVLLNNALQHGSPESVSIKVECEGEHAWVVVSDDGRALAPDLRAQAFSIDGQQEIKGRTDGRYSRVAGLLAARALADSVGAELSAFGDDGAARFLLKLRLAKA